MQKHVILTKNLQIKISPSPFKVLEISDKQTGKIFCLNGEMSFIVRSPSHISDAPLIYVLDTFSADPSGLCLRLRDESNKHSAELKISDNEYGIKFAAHITADEIIWLAEWKLSGYLFDQVIVPALGGQSLSKDMTPELTLSYKYPFWWNAQFVLGESGNDGLMLHTKDSGPDLKLLRVRRTEGEFQLSLGFEAVAPLGKKEINAVWFIDSYRKDWRAAVDRHRDWMEKAFELSPLTENPYAPEWMTKINFVLEPWGMRKDQAEPHHTFEQMKVRLLEFSKLHNPQNTLLYIPGFAHNGIDSHAPDYAPSIQCGGEKKLIELINSAHQLGYKVMLHTNVLALTFNHPIYEEFRKFQVVDVFNRKQGWAMDIDGDWLVEEYFAYVNPGYSEWGDYMETEIGRLINKYKTDAVFLDQTLLAFNVSNGPNFQIGMRNHIKRLQKNFPNTLFAGEGLNEQVLSALPMAQIHGIDSLSEVHGMEGKKRWRKVHPVSTYLFGKYTRFTAHLLTKYPKHPMFRLQENAYRKLDVIPALSLYDYKQKMDIPEVYKMIKRAGRLKIYNYPKQIKNEDH